MLPISRHVQDKNKRSTIPRLELCGADILCEGSTGCEDKTLLGVVNLSEWQWLHFIGACWNDWEQKTKDNASDFCTSQEIDCLSTHHTLVACGKGLQSSPQARGGSARLSFDLAQMEAWFNYRPLVPLDCEWGWDRSSTVALWKHCLTHLWKLRQTPPPATFGNGVLRSLRCQVAYIFPQCQGWGCRTLERGWTRSR